MANAWAHLPNAKLIDRLAADYARQPDAWSDAWGQTASLVGKATRDIVWRGTWTEASGADHAATRACVRKLESALLWRPCITLIAWPEDSALMLDMPVDAVRLLAASGHHPAVLMLPACIALNSI